MARTACFVCLISTVSGCSKKRPKSAALVAGTQQTLGNLYFLLISMCATFLIIYIFQSVLSHCGEGSGTYSFQLSPVIFLQKANTSVRIGKQKNKILQAFTETAKFSAYFKSKEHFDNIIHSCLRNLAQQSQTKIIANIAMTLVTLCSDLDIQQSHTHGLYYKHIIIINDDSRVISNCGVTFRQLQRCHLCPQGLQLRSQRTFIVQASVMTIVIFHCHITIIQATGLRVRHSIQQEKTLRR